MLILITKQSGRQNVLVMCLIVMKSLEEKMIYLHTERQSVFFESIEVKNQLLSGFGQRGQISIAVHIDGLPFQHL